MRLSMKFHIKDLNAWGAEMQGGGVAWAKENVQSMQSSTLCIRRPDRVSAGKGPLHSLLTLGGTSSCGQSFNNRSGPWNTSSKRPRVPCRRQPIPRGVEGFIGPNLCSDTGPHAWKDSMLGLMFCSRCSKILNNILTRGSSFSLCSWSSPEVYFKLRTCYSKKAIDNIRDRGRPGSYHRGDLLKKWEMVNGQKSNMIKA